MPFQKGHTYYNTGRTRFKKGHQKPKNAYQFPKENKTGFKNGNTPWNKRKKGLQTAWNKGKKLPQYSGKNHPRWKGGITKSAGYVFIFQPNHPFAKQNGYVREHRFIVEQQIGRYLLPREKTHHLGRKDNNRPQMLMAFINHSAHIRFEKNPNNVKPEEIIFDGRKLYI